MQRRLEVENSGKKFPRRFNDAALPTKCEESLVFRRSYGYSSESSERCWRRYIEPDLTTTLHLHIKDYARVVIYNQQGRKIKDTGMPVCDEFGKLLISDEESERLKVPNNMIPRDPRMKITPRTLIADKKVQTAISFGRRLGQSVRFFNMATLHEYDPQSSTTVETSNTAVRYVDEPTTSPAKRTNLHAMEEEHCASCASVIAGAYHFAMCPQHGGASALPITNGPMERRNSRINTPTASTSTAIVKDSVWILDGKNYPKPRPMKMTVRDAHDKRVETTSPYRNKRLPLPRRTSMEKFPFTLPKGGRDQYKDVSTDSRRSRQYRVANRHSPPPPPLGESTSHREKTELRQQDKKHIHPPSELAHENEFKK
jgi:hypothetical protein